MVSHKARVGSSSIDQSQALGNGDGMVDGFVYHSYFFFGFLALLAFVSDVRWSTRFSTNAKQRLTRHLCRMCFAMLLVGASVFLGQADVFPVVLQRFGLLALPLVIVAAVMVYWIYILRLRNVNLLKEGGLRK